MGGSWGCIYLRRKKCDQTETWLCGISFCIFRFSKLNLLFFISPLLLFVVLLIASLVSQSGTLPKLNAFRGMGNLAFKEKHTVAAFFIGIVISGIYENIYSCGQIALEKRSLSNFLLGWGANRLPAA